MSLKAVVVGLNEVTRLGLNTATFAIELAQAAHVRYSPADAL